MVRWWVWPVVLFIQCVCVCGGGGGGDQEFDELEVYGSGQSSSLFTMASYKFEVFDSLLNIGPIRNLTISQPAFLAVSIIY